MKFNFEIDDEKYTELRNKFYEKLDFLFTNEKFYSQNENSIVLKSQIDEKLIERAQIIFATERWMKSYFFLETKIALDEIVLMIFEEFKEIIHQIWKTIFDNFETFDFTKLFESSENVSDSFSSKIEEENLYNLPPIVKIYFDSYNQQKLELINNEIVVSRKKKNWVKRIYIFVKKFNKRTNYELQRNSETAKYNYKRNRIIKN
ncbi:hypothetical protein [Epilithonimonas xixisoli]|uniref:hypothetical protein n=1 Tax=Epilithonimonas xixisoli TaxID=1476462 RepID=UPI001416F9CA|nr:hypothetical protein [Epilithonimonas xixisoli]